MPVDAQAVAPKAEQGEEPADGQIVPVDPQAVKPKEEPAEDRARSWQWQSKQ